MTARLHILRIRMSSGELNTFAEAARKAGLAVSTWARSELIGAASRNAVREKSRNETEEK